MTIFPTSSLILLLAPAGLAAPPVAGSGDTGMKAESIQTETESQTIAKCVRDARSESAEIRRRAMMVLGKYQTPLARSILTRGLADADPRVRIAALVSLTEAGIPPSNEARLMLGMIDDPDVHIRRLVSSILPQLLLTANNFAMFGEPAPDAGKRNEALTKSLIAAFADADAVVRKNMVTHYSSVARRVDPEVLIPLLQDDDRDVRSLALKMALSHLKPEQTPGLAALAEDPDRLIRLNLAKGLVDGGRTGAGNVLKRLIDDPDPLVRAHALLGLIRRREFDDVERIDTILNAPGVDPELGERIIHSLGGLPERPTALLRRLLEHQRPAYRAAALRIHSFGGGRNPLPLDRMKAFLNDESADVRRVAARHLVRPGRLDSDTIEEMLASPHDEIREVLLEVARRFNDDDATELLMDLLLDEYRDIRERALSNYARRRLPGWRDVLAQSLEDDDPRIRHAAVNLLMFCADPKGFEVLRKHAEDCEDPRTRAMINFFLKSKTDAAAGDADGRVKGEGR